MCSHSSPPPSLLTSAAACRGSAGCGHPTGHRQHWAGPAAAPRPPGTLRFHPKDPIHSIFNILRAFGHPIVCLCRVSVFLFFCHFGSGGTTPNGCLIDKDTIYVKTTYLLPVTIKIRYTSLIFAIYLGYITLMHMCIFPNMNLNPMKVWHVPLFIHVFITSTRAEHGFHRPQNHPRTLDWGVEVKVHVWSSCIGGHVIWARISCYR